MAEQLRPEIETVQAAQLLAQRRAMIANEERKVMQQKNDALLVYTTKRTETPKAPEMMNAVRKMYPPTSNDSGHSGGRGG